MSALTTAKMVKEPKLSLTNFLVLPYRTPEFKNSQLLGNGKVKYYDKHTN